MNANVNVLILGTHGTSIKFPAETHGIVRAWPFRLRLLVFTDHHFLAHHFYHPPAFVLNPLAA